MNSAIRRSMYMIGATTLVLLLGFSSTQPAATLDPGQPNSYLEQGELLLAQAEGREETRRARQILAMGAVLAHRTGQDDIAASCCIALVDGQDDPALISQAWDLALMLDPSRLAAWAQQRNMAHATDSSALGAECLRLARNAEVGDASALYQRATVRQAIRDAALRLGLPVQDVTRVIDGLLTTTGRDECRGRVFSTQVHDGESVRVLCDDHTHPIATTGDVESLRMLLAIELECLESSTGLEDWASAWSMHQQRPFEAPSIEQLIELYQIDPARPYLVNGQWSSTR
ncbi:MAG: hypothetical protein CMJ35_08120 [Phycisphaerae bacterium]|nr:hypothetical protein [Phycisphaerae bacterium]MBM91564.1 hypothetical protein [Phycisphaerae bacterium]